MKDKKLLLASVIILIIISPGFVKADDLEDPEENSPMMQEPNWTFDTESENISLYLSSHGELYVFDTENNKIVSVRERGLMEWEHSFEYNLTRLADFNRKSTFIVTENDYENRLSKLDTSEGTKLWSNTFNEDINDIIVNDKNQIYLSSYSGEIIKLSKNGDPIWNKTISKDKEPIDIELDNDENLYAFSKNGDIYYLNPEGKELWDLNISSKISTIEHITSLNIGGENVYLITNKTIYDLNKEGELKTIYEVKKGQISSHSFIRNSKFYILISMSESFSVKSIKKNGFEKWEYELSVKSNKTNIIIGLAHNDRIYCQFFNNSKDGNGDVFKVLCFEQDGKLAWKQIYKEENRGFHYISEKGKIYFATDNGIVYSYQGQPSVAEGYSRWTTTLGLILAIGIFVILFIILNAVWEGISEQKKQNKEQQ